MNAVVDLFDGLPRRATDFSLGSEIVANLPVFESISPEWLHTNLLAVQNHVDPEGNLIERSLLGVTYDDPITALSFFAQKLYPAMKADLQKNDPQTWQRYIVLATKPVGISCEFCCGIGPVGITSAGELRCGCSHNPAVQAITMYLMKNTKMSDAEILQEVLRWKSIWFPKNMVGLALQLAGGDTSALTNVPGMVGGC